MKCCLLAIFCFLSCFSQGQNVVRVSALGAKGDGVSDDAVFIQKAIDSCHAQGGGRVLLDGAKVYLSGPLDLKSNIELFLAAGTKLLANPDEKVYTRSAFNENVGEGTTWLSADHVENLSFAGKGSIDGNGIAFMGAELEDSYVLKSFHVKDPRPHVLTIFGGKNIRMHDLTICNSAYWTVHLVGCEDVVISGISLLNPLKIRNSDGIDIDHSKNVRISDCFIESGDDCICLKNRREFAEYGACENIVVNNCTMTSRSCAIKIGSENMDTIRQVLINGCIIRNSNRGIGIQNRDEGAVEDVTFSNIVIDSHLFSDVWWGKGEVIYVTAYHRANSNDKDANWRFPKGVSQGKVGVVRNIRFQDITCKGENGVFVGGETPDKIQHVLFDGVDLSIEKTTQHIGGQYDRRPSYLGSFVTGSTAGFYLDQAADITIRNSSVSWGKTNPDYFSYVLQSRGIKGLLTQNLSGEAAFPNKLKPFHIEN